VGPWRRRADEPARAEWPPGGGIDFGCCGIGDPACDTVIAWTFLSQPSRKRFRAALGVDSGTWSRGRGWALWKALLSLHGYLEQDAEEAGRARHQIDEILAG
jgi:aminoglycoside phosphotransferase (APT) family kinase protein